MGPAIPLAGPPGFVPPFLAPRLRGAAIAGQGLASNSWAELQAECGAPIAAQVGNCLRSGLGVFYPRPRRGVLATGPSRPKRPAAMAASRRELTASLPHDALAWLYTVIGESTSRSTIQRVVTPSLRNSTISYSRVVTRLRSEQTPPTAPAWVLTCRRSWLTLADVEEGGGGAAALSTDS